MDRITAMQVFTEVADRASLTEAARALDMSRAMVSRYLESFERWLGIRVLHRTTRRVSLTDAGEEALQRCRQMLELSRDVQNVAGARRAAPGGKLRITTSTSFAAAYLADVVTDFLLRHPQTQVELIALERTVNLVEERIDVAVRIGNVLYDSLVARKLGVCRSVVCASQAYTGQCFQRPGRPPTPIASPRSSAAPTPPPTNGPTLGFPQWTTQSNDAVTRRAALPAPDCDVADLLRQRGLAARTHRSPDWEPGLQYRGVFVSPASAS
jgi:DNA-binding transcriptional LysR family regulator